MKAVVYLGPSHVKVTDVEQPLIRDGEALIRVAFSGICGTDLAIVSGKHPRAKPPLVLGHEFSGELVEINDNDGDSGFKPGNLVAVYPLLMCGKCLACRSGYAHVCRNLRLIGIDRAGSMAEYVSVPVCLLVKLDDGIDMKLAALIEPVAVAVHSIRESGIGVGDKILITGAGPIGCLLALLLRNLGYENLIISEIKPHRKRRMKEFGFEVLDPAKKDFDPSSTVSEIRPFIINDL